MLYNEFRGPIIRLATAVVFMVATLLVPNLRADPVDTCTEVAEWCGPNIMWYYQGPWPGDPGCHTWLYYCPPPNGPVYSACDVCYG